MSHLDELSSKAGPWHPSPWLEWAVVGLIALVYAVVVRAVWVARGE